MESVTVNAAEGFAEWSTVAPTSEALEAYAGVFLSISLAISLLWSMRYYARQHSQLKEGECSVCRSDATLTVRRLHACVDDCPYACELCWRQYLLGQIGSLHQLQCMRPARAGEAPHEVHAYDVLGRAFTPRLWPALAGAYVLTLPRRRLRVPASLRFLLSAEFLLRPVELVVVGSLFVLSNGWNAAPAFTPAMTRTATRLLFLTALTPNPIPFLWPWLPLYWLYSALVSCVARGLKLFFFPLGLAVEYVGVCALVYGVQQAAQWPFVQDVLTSTDRFVDFALEGMRTLVEMATVVARAAGHFQHTLRRDWVRMSPLGRGTCTCLTGAGTLYLAYRCTSVLWLAVWYPRLTALLVVAAAGALSHSPRVRDALDAAAEMRRAETANRPAEAPDAVRPPAEPVGPTPHQTNVWQAYVAEEQRMEATYRMCPHCRRVVERVAGCNDMVCGRDFHAAQAQGTPGCNQPFQWSEAPRYVASTRCTESYIAGEREVSGSLRGPATSTHANNVNMCRQRRRARVVTRDDTKRMGVQRK